MTDEEYLEAFGRLTEEITRLRAENECLTRELSDINGYLDGLGIDRGKPSIIDRISTAFWRLEKEKCEAFNDMANKEKCEAFNDMANIALSHRKHWVNGGAATTYGRGYQAACENIANVALAKARGE